MKRVIWLMLILLIAIPARAAAEADPMDDIYGDESVYILRLPDGAPLTSRAGRVYVGDEYISRDNQLYRVVEVNDTTREASVTHLGEEPPVDKTVEIYASADEKTKKIAMYCTHSDESYVPTDGTESKTKDAGIYDVSQTLSDAFQSLGIEVERSTETHLPHDAKAYSRSRRTAEELLKSGPDALLDIHRDGIPDESEYETKVDGEKMTMVRLLVGRSNPNSSANRDFAKEIKAVADEMYPDLIKDIYIGKGDYNQELYPQSILLEFGTHVTGKEEAEKSAPYIAEVISKVLYGDTAKAEAPAEGKSEKNSAGGIGILWIVLTVVIGVGIYALIATGTWKGMWNRISRGTSEITGGAMGKKPKDRK